MSASITEPHPGSWVARCFVRHRQIAIGVVEERGVDHAGTVVGRHVIDQELHRGNPATSGEYGDGCRGVGLVVDVCSIDRIGHGEFAGHHRIEQATVVWNIVNQTSAALGLAERRQPLWHCEVGDFAIGRVE